MCLLTRLDNSCRAALADQHRPTYVCTSTHDVLAHMRKLALHETASGWTACLDVGEAVLHAVNLLDNTLRRAEHPL